jgi:LemA protein
VVVLIVAASVSSGCSYNTFVSKEEGVKAQWAQVENQLQRRNDLIPNLVETTKGIAQQEKDVFGQIAASRAKLAGATTPDQTIQAANEQSAARTTARDRRELSPAAIERDLQPLDG